MSAFHDNALMGASGSQGYQISRSVRLRSSASAYFNRTNSSSPTNSIKWTWSGWVKRGSLGSQQNLVGATNSGSDDTYFNFNSSDKIVLGSYTGAGTDYGITTAAVFRDPSAWYHIVAVLDTANATSADRAIIYVNGVRQTVTNSANGMWPQNATNNKINTASQVVNIGRRSLGDSYLDGYLTEINFIDGQALTPTSFGQFNSVTGVWQPLKYTGTYGTNGFYLNFSDNSNNTAATIGKDYSGNGNNWTPNNISVTSGVTYDSMIDSPTVSAVSSNYAVLNRLSYSLYGSCSDGNLKFQGATDWGGSKSSIAIPTTGKWYAEFTLGSTSSNSAQAGFGIFPASTGNNYDWTGSYGLLMNSGFFLVTNGSFSSNRGGTTAAGTVLQIAVDADAGKVWLGVANAWYDTYNTTNGNPGSGTNPSGSGINFATTTFFMGVQTDFNNWNANFGQRPFSYTPPSGFNALNTFNLPTPTIVNGALYMNATTYSGTTGVQAVTNSGGMQPDLVWIKVRNIVANNVLQDSVRGTTAYLQSNVTTAENTNTSYDWFRSFNSNGFTVASSTTGGTPTSEWNTSGNTYVGWQWQAGKGTTSSNTNGSITSTVSVNATAGFSIVTYTGNGATSSGVTIGHGLGVTPAFIITKNRVTTTAGNNYWSCWHKDLGGNYGIWLNLTSARNSSMWAGYTNINSTVFSPPDLSYGNVNGDTYINYCFAPVAGYSAFGSYTGNGSSDGPFVFLGFRPRWIMLKSSTSIQDWKILDTSRNTYNSTNSLLGANISAAEDTNTAYDFDILSNGFKPRNTFGYANTNGATYIYACFAENPFKLALAR